MLQATSPPEVNADKFRADRAKQAREVQLREKIGLGHADLRVGGTQLLFGFADVRPPLQQSGRQTGGNVRRQFAFRAKTLRAKSRRDSARAKRSIDFPARRSAVPGSGMVAAAESIKRFGR